MQTTIIAHNTTTATARIRFEHLGEAVEDTYDLVAVIPGTRAALAEGQQLPPQAQQAVISHLQAVIQRGIEDGNIKGPPAPDGVLSAAEDPNQLALPL